MTGTFGQVVEYGRDYDVIYNPTDVTLSANPTTQCSDAGDNDGDGKIDYRSPGNNPDPGCSSAADNSENSDSVPECSNGVDDDSDGKTDYPNDPGCSSGIRHHREPRPRSQSAVFERARRRRRSQDRLPQRSGLQLGLRHLREPRPV